MHNLHVSRLSSPRCVFGALRRLLGRKHNAADVHGQGAPHTHKSGASPLSNLERSQSESNIEPETSSDELTVRGQAAMVLAAAPQRASPSAVSVEQGVEQAASESTGHFIGRLELEPVAVVQVPIDSDFPPSAQHIPGKSGAWTPEPSVQQTAAAVTTPLATSFSDAMERVNSEQRISSEQRARLAIAERDVLAQEKALRADAWGRKHPASTDWLRRDATEIMWRETERQGKDAASLRQKWGFEDMLDMESGDSEEDWRLQEFQALLDKELSWRKAAYRWWLKVHYISPQTRVRDVG